MNTIKNTARLHHFAAVSVAMLLAMGSAHAQITRTVTSTYDSLGQLATETVEPNGDINTVKLKTTYTREPNTGVVTVRHVDYRDPKTGTDVARDVETLAYDAKKRYATTVTNAKTQSESRSYDEATGNLLTLTGPNQLTTTWQYDGWGRKTQETRADGTATTWAYRRCIDWCVNSSVNVSITQNWISSGGVLQGQTTVPSEAFTDALGRVVFTRTWGFDGTAIIGERLYNTLGQLSQIPRDRYVSTTPVWSTTEYDPIGRVSNVRTPNAAGNGDDVTHTDYNGLDTTVTNAAGQKRTEHRNALGKLKTVTDHYNYVTSYLYDGFGNLLRTTDPQGNQIVVTYDNLGRKTQLQDPDLGTWTYKVNPLGQTWKQTDAKAQDTYYVFDELGRLTQRLETDLDSRWVYDTATTGVGKLAEAYTWASGTSTKTYQRLYAYDALGRSGSVTTRLDWDYVQESGYDSFGRRNSTTYRRNAITGSGGPYNKLITAYNAQGYASQLTRDDGSTTATVWTAQVMDAEGRLRQEQLGNGLYTQRGYNGNTGRLESITSGPSVGGNTVQNDQYTYDAVGNLGSRTQLISTSGSQLSENFTYDNLNRLKSSTVGGQAGKTFDYDSIGNLTNKAGALYTYLTTGNTRPHAVSSIAGTMAGVTNPGFGYDGNGNLLDGLNRHYTWTAGNQARAIDKMSSGAAVERTEFVFDTEHQRIKQIVSPVSGGVQGAASRTIFYGAGMEKEVDATANTTAIRTYIPGGLGYIEEKFTGTAIASTSSGMRNLRYMLVDHLGSAIAMVDQSQTVLQRMSYDPWGKRRDADGTDDAAANLGGIANANDHTGYTGQEQLDQLGLVHLNGRVYDPITGRMTSGDPTIPNASDQQAINRYSYVLNNALRFTDPSGFNAADGHMNCSSGVYCNVYKFDVNSLPEDRPKPDPVGPPIHGPLIGGPSISIAFNGTAAEVWSLLSSVGAVQAATPSAPAGTSGAPAGNVPQKVEINGPKLAIATGGLILRDAGGQGLRLLSRPGPVLAGSLAVMVGKAAYDRTKATGRPMFEDAEVTLWSTMNGTDQGQDGEKALGANNVPPVPDVLVGDQSDPRAGPNKGGGKHTSGPLTPENGGTGDFQSDLDKLTGGVRPWQPGDKAPPGSLVGANGIFGRPSNSTGGQSIDIPANGSKPHETLHYP